MTNMEIALELMTEDEKLLLVRYVLEYIHKRAIEQEEKKAQETFLLPIDKTLQ